MPTTTDQVATIRALLKGETEEREQLEERLDESDSWDGYAALAVTGFIKAVERRFTASDSTAIIDFVASVRSNSEEFSEKIDPIAAERLIKAVQGPEDIDDLDATDALGIQTALLIALIRDAQLDDAELDAFIAEAKELADQWVDEAP